MTLTGYGVCAIVGNWALFFCAAGLASSLTSFGFFGGGFLATWQCARLRRIGIFSQILN